MRKLKRSLRSPDRLDVVHDVQFVLQYGPLIAHAPCMITIDDLRLDPR